MRSFDLVTLEKKKISLNERRISRFLLFCEDLIKVPLFGCQHCGECVLSSTAFVCSQRCPKRLRNGPCGGTGDKGHCEVFPERKCVWFVIYKRAKWLHITSTLYQIKKIHNWNLEESSAWLNVFRKRIDSPIWPFSKKQKAIKEIIQNDTAG
ncbi:methylenetetrahydrofolate reductase C-terminal domain-containing protein [bacterium]|jgi:methylenetetrahydrofolate reductase (NADPH)|nr:methylenetetrahydrofolate reductase C-terminal domain-containing protein [bacterium]